MVIGKSGSLKRSVSLFVGLLSGVYCAEARPMAMDDAILDVDFDSQAQRQFAVELYPEENVPFNADRLTVLSRDLRQWRLLISSLSLENDELVSVEAVFVSTVNSRRVSLPISGFRVSEASWNIDLDFPFDALRTGQDCLGILLVASFRDPSDPDAVKRFVRFLKLLEEPDELLICPGGVDVGSAIDAPKQVGADSGASGSTSLKSPAFDLTENAATAQSVVGCSLRSEGSHVISIAAFFGLIFACAFFWRRRAAVSHSRILRRVD